MPGVEDDQFEEEDQVTGGSIPVGPTSSGPRPSSIAPDDPTEPQQRAADEAPSAQEPLPEFDPKVRQEFEGLLYLGRLTKTFTWMGHSFTIRTLTVGEVLEVGLLHKDYLNTYADVKAYQAAVVAACVMAVDGKPLPMPLTNTPADTSLANRFQYVLRSWHPPVLDAIYEEYLVLEARVEEVIMAMGKVPGSTDESVLTSTAASV